MACLPLIIEPYVIVTWYTCPGVKPVKTLRNGIESPSRQCELRLPQQAVVQLAPVHCWSPFVPLEHCSRRNVGVDKVCEVVLEDATPLENAVPAARSKQVTAASRSFELNFKKHFFPWSIIIPPSK